MRIASTRTNPPTVVGGAERSGPNTRIVPFAVPTSVLSSLRASDRGASMVTRCSRTAPSTAISTKPSGPTARNPSPTVTRSTSPGIGDCTTFGAGASSAPGATCSVTDPPSAARTAVVDPATARVDAGPWATTSPTGAVVPRGESTAEAGGRVGAFDVFSAVLSPQAANVTAIVVASRTAVAFVRTRMSSILRDRGAEPVDG